MRLKFLVFSDGDPSVGIWGLEASVEIETGYDEIELQDIENWRKAIADQYEDEIGLKIYTEAEYKEELEAEKEFFGGKNL